MWTRMGRAEMFTPLEKNAREKCLIKEKFQRELSGQGKEKTKGKQNKINKGPLTDSAQAFLQKAPPQAALLEEQASLRTIALPRWAQAVS